MSEKKVKDAGVKDVKVENTSVEETKAPEAWKFGTAPILVINVVREKKVYRFEMPIGAHLDECEEACNECIKVVKMMKEEGERKMAEEKDKKKSESSDEEKASVEEK